MNEVAEELTGWSLHDALQKPAKEVFNIINEHTHQKVDDPVTKVLDKGTVVGLANHTLLVRRDRTEVAIDDSGAPIKDRNGNTLGVVLVFRDISDRKQAMKEIESLAKFPEENPNPIMRIATDGAIIYANPSSAPLLKAWECQVGEMLPDDYRNLILDAYSSGNRIETEATSGGTIYSLIIAPIVDMSYVNVYGRDVTQHRLADKALKDSEQRFRDAIDHFPNVLAIYDADRRVEYVNSNGLQIMGLSEQKVIGKKDEEIFPPETINSYLPALKRAVETKMPQALERTRPVSMGGQTIIANIIPRLNEDGEIRQILCLSYDISERKRAEEELRLAHDDLEMKVLERTEELAYAKEELETTNEELQIELEEQKRIEEELLKAKEKAEDASRAKSDFMATMSHEIRTPMNAVIGLTGLLLDDGELSAEQRDFIETIRTSGDALMTIINDILDISKLEAEKVMLEEQPFNLKSCIEEALDLVAIRAAEKGLNLTYTVEKNVPANIISDPSRLRQILGNLLGNAVKFTNAGDVKLNVTSHQLDGHHEIHFAVEDTGIGIPMDKMDHLFRPFSQVDASVTRRYGGTGLGLAISKKLVELMGGKIWAESEIGKGSTFHFTIETPVTSDEPKPLLSAVQPQMVGKRILIVDDSRTNRRVLGIQAYTWGMLPVTVSSSQEALKWINRGDDFDVVILNMNMPVMDGLTLAREIRKTNDILPIVMLTRVGEHVPSDLVERSLNKPIKPSQLHDVLMGVFGKNLIQEIALPVAKNEMQTPRILLAEDNVSSQKVTLAMLKRLGYCADAVANGLEALQALGRQHYDIVLMDVRMPEMDGLEATQIIRKRWPKNGLKVVAITAYALEGDREKCLDAGMDDYISKPVKLDELAGVLSRFANQKIATEGVEEGSQ